MGRDCQYPIHSQLLNFLKNLWSTYAHTLMAIMRAAKSTSISRNLLQLSTKSYEQLSQFNSLTCFEERYLMGSSLMSNLYHGLCIFHILDALGPSYICVLDILWCRMHRSQHNIAHVMTCVHLPLPQIQFGRARGPTSALNFFKFAFAICQAHGTWVEANVMSALHM